MYCDIPSLKNSGITQKINKGWSEDEKYYIEMKTKQKFLLRVSDISQYDNKKKEYNILCKYAQLGFVMSQPIEFGVCNEGQSVYMILSWVEGDDLETALPKLLANKQYVLGRKAGEILKKIHSINVLEKDRPKESKIPKKLLQLERYANSDVRVPNDEFAIQFIRDNINKIWSVPPVYQHGDYHPGNLILTKENEIGVIDFNRWEIGDPYEEFYKLESFGTEVSIPYCIGQIDAYFEDNIPEDFWKILAVYVAHSSLYSIKWAEKFGQKDMDGMVLRCKRAFEDYNDFKNNVPKWYQKW